MPRDIPVGNGNLLVNFDLDYRMRDIYFPWIGLENHTRGQEFRFGIWVDGCFSWMGLEWEKDLRYRDDSLVTEVFLQNETLGLALRCQDALISNCMRISSRSRSSAWRGDRVTSGFFLAMTFTGMARRSATRLFFDPRTESIIHYKLNRYFLANCSTAESKVADYFSCDAKDASGNRPSWKDAEDGELIGSPIAWGSVESTVGVRLSLPPGGAHNTVFYWLAAPARTTRRRRTCIGGWSTRHRQP